MAISEGTLAIGNKVIVPSGSGGSNSLSELNDVNISNASDGQVLVYDEATNKWKNENNITASQVLYDSNTSVKAKIDSIKYTKIAESSANVTYATQLGELKTTFNTLTEAQKLTAKLKQGTLFYDCYNTNGEFFATFPYNNVIRYRDLSLSNSKYQESSGSNWTDVSSMTASIVLELWALM